MFSNTRLKLARQRLGWSLSRLSDESGVSSRSLSNYENDADHEPSQEAIDKLAGALKVPAAFFARPEVDQVPLEAVSFRKLSKTSAAKRDAVLAAATLALEFFAVVDRHFTLPKVDVPTLDKLKPEDAAELVRRRWGLGDKPISNMVHLLESKGVRVMAISHEYSEVDAFCFLRDSVPYVFLNTSKSGERQRFDAAHELGHLVLHDERPMTPGDSKEREAEANRFAASFLMPGTAVYAQSMQSASLERILAARKYWRVSAMALTHRLHSLDLLSEWQYRSTCVTLSDRGFRSGEPDGIVPETSAMLRQVLYGDNSLGLTAVSTELAIERRDLATLMQGLVPVAA